MAQGGDDALLIKVAVFGAAMSLMATVLITVLLSGGLGDYDRTQIAGYRDDLVSFSGESMLNDTPWVLTEVYTPWSEDMGVEGHLTDDGWLYGDYVAYPEIGKSAAIKLDAGQKSSRLLDVGNRVSYDVKELRSWAQDGNPIGIPAKLLGKIIPIIDESRYQTVERTANQWDYTGYRYVFDPTLPFASGSSSRDGSLSIVWYSFGGAEGLSGGLEIYAGGSSNVKLASYAATDIIKGYNSSGGLASTYDFDFQGTHLNLSVRFDQDVIASGVPLMQAWESGNWSMAVSSASAGNFFDVEESTSFATTTGNIITTFMQIYTFSVPEIDNAWMSAILWIMVSLPMTIAMMCVVMRFVGGVTRIFGGL